MVRPSFPTSVTQSQNLRNLWFTVFASILLVSCGSGIISYGGQYVRAQLQIQCITNMADYEQELAECMVHDIKDALSRGIKHYNAKGELLDDVMSIIICMMTEGDIRREES